MKICKKGILILSAVITLILSSSTTLASTETDGTNDVFHWRVSDGNWGWGFNIADKDNIDITELSYEANDNQLTITLKVDGIIEDSKLIAYYAYYTSADATYWIMYTNGSAVGYCNEDYIIGANAVVTKTSEDTLTGVFSLYGSDTSKVDLYATAWQYTEVNNQLAEYWVDWNPDTHFPGAGDDDDDDDTGDDDDDDTGDDDDDDTGNGGDGSKKKDSPGFEIIALIAAIGFALILLRRRK